MRDSGIGPYDRKAYVSVCVYTGNWIIRVNIMEDIYCRVHNTPEGIHREKNILGLAIRHSFYNFKAPEL
jgi:hypothetical protein